jgi:hypothetical protein
MRQTLQLRRQLSPLESLELSSPTKPNLDSLKSDESEKKVKGFDFLKQYYESLKDQKRMAITVKPRTPQEYTRQTRLAPQPLIQSPVRGLFNEIEIEKEVLKSKLERQQAWQEFQS